MKKIHAATTAAMSAALFLLVLGMPIAHAYYTTNAPTATFSSGENVMFAEFTMSAFGGVSDSKAGSNYFSYLESTQAIVLYNSPPLSWWNDFYYQPDVGYTGSDFTFNPQIWVCVVVCSGWGTANEVWSSNQGNVYAMGTPSNLPDYIVLVGVNTGSSNQGFTVTSCNIGVTVDSYSEFAEILYTPTCTNEYSQNVSFGSTYNYVQTISQPGLLGYGDGSKATFTSTVASAETFGASCVSNGCTYTFGTNSEVQETSNLQYYPSHDSGGYHVYVCQETSGESTC